MKIIILSSLARDTGCFLRGKYLAESMSPFAEVVYLHPLQKSLPYKADIIISIFINLFRVIFTRADVYIGMKPFPNVILPLLVKKYLCRKKIVVDIDDLDAGYQSGFTAKIVALLQKPFVRHFDLITYHNDLLAEYIKKTFKVKNKKLYQLSQGVNFRVFNPDQYDHRLRSFFPEDKKIVLYCGHLNVASDLEPVLNAMRIVQSSVDCSFIVAGGGPDEKYFRHKAKQIGVDAYFSGLIAGERAASFMNIADLVLVYYEDKEVNYYRCPMKLRESLAMGKKVVCDDVGELKDFVAYTYQTSPDIKQFASKIIEVLTQAKDKREDAGAKIYKRFFGLGNYW